MPETMKNFPKLFRLSICVRICLESLDQVSALDAVDQAHALESLDYQVL
jgi:hypothetical protein